jgi:hypothetical protein
MGLKWSWCWREDNIANLWCFCPQCDYELSYSEEEMVDAIWLLAFKCEHCQKYYRFKGYNKDYLLNVIKREIHRKIRTGEKPDKKRDSNV